MLDRRREMTRADERDRQEADDDTGGMFEDGREED
jgi:hypothetical protein